MSAALPPSRTVVIGVGNPLMGDDGVGIAAVGRLARRPLPDGTEVLDGGTGGLTLLHLMEGARKAILVDAAATGRPPGTVVRFGPGIVAGTAEAPLSLHGGGLGEVFALGRELGLLPESIVLFGVEPASVEPRLGLSPEVEGAIPLLLDRLLEELRPLP